MIEFTSGDILKDEAEAIVNTVNCVGIMGRGIALQFKNAWPENFKAYQTACKRNEVQPGRMFMFEVGQLTSPRWIVNFPTKRHWKGKSRMEDIDAGLQALAAAVAEPSFARLQFRTALLTVLLHELEHLAHPEHREQAVRGTSDGFYQEVLNELLGEEGGSARYGMQPTPLLP